MPHKKVSTRKNPNIGTAGRIQALALYREQHMQEKGTSPIWTATCNRMGIDIKTVLRHAPELAKKWYDINFHW
jgi:hypothetical protein